MSNGRVDRSKLHLNKALEMARLVESSRGQLYYEYNLQRLYKWVRRHPEVRKQVVAGRPLLDCDLGMLEIGKARQRDRVEQVRRIAEMGESFGRDMLHRLQERLNREAKL